MVEPINLYDFQPKLGIFQYITFKCVLETDTAALNVNKNTQKFNFQVGTYQILFSQNFQHQLSYKP